MIDKWIMRVCLALLLVACFYIGSQIPAAPECDAHYVFCPGDR